MKKLVESIALLGCYGGFIVGGHHLLDDAMDQASLVERPPVVTHVPESMEPVAQAIENTDVPTLIFTGVSAAGAIGIAVFRLSKN